MKADVGRKHSAVEVSADSTSAIVDGLAEKTEYMLTVTTITEEYFDNLHEGENKTGISFAGIVVSLFAPKSPFMPLVLALLCRARVASDAQFAAAGGAARGRVAAEQ